tara:strand:+ start:1405 stop:2067 length:663 start_codon:yes stop_codon:yes gene_type:complete
MTDKLKIVARDIETILPYEKNAKIHDELQVTKLAQQISEHGWDQPIVVDADGVIIKGHGRRLAALKLGMTQVPVIVRDDLTPDQVKAARLADNRVSSTDYDTELLQAELAALAMTDDLLNTGFDARELDFLTADLGDFSDEKVVIDLGASVDAQTRTQEAAIENAKKGDVAITDLLGFKRVPATMQKIVAAFIGRIEEETEAEGLDAFLMYAEKHSGLPA